MPLLTWSSLFLLPELLLLVQLPVTSYDDRVIAASEVHELFTKIHNVMGSAVSNRLAVRLIL